MYYAQLTNDVVTAVTETSEVINDPNLIEIQGLDSSLLGSTYANGVFTPPVTPPDPCEWLIDIGPFYDRFDDAKMQVLTSTDAGVKAIISDASIRKWIDLERTDLVTSLAYIGSVIPAVDSALRTAILTTPVSNEENLALRKLFFS